MTRLLIALDIDGTIVHEDNSLSPRVTSAVLAAVAAGHEVVLATGRSQATTESTAVRLGIEPSHLISANGALVLARAGDTYAPVHVETFDPSDALRTIIKGLPQGSFMIEDAAGHRRYTEGMHDWNLEAAEQVEFEELLTIPALRVVVMSPSHRVDEFLRIVEGMGLHKVSYAVGFSSWLDIAPDGVNKAAALERVADRVGIARENIVAVGDGRNDIEMLQWVATGGGRAIAMGQAPPEVVAAATETTATVTDDGLAVALERLVHLGAG